MYLPAPTPFTYLYLPTPCTYLHLPHVPTSRTYHLYLPHVPNAIPHAPTLYRGAVPIATYVTLAVLTGAYQGTCTRLYLSMVPDSTPWYLPMVSVIAGTYLRYLYSLVPT